MAEPRLTGLHFWVRDIEATLAFYRAIGLELRDDAYTGDFLRAQLPNGLEVAFGTYGLTRRYDPAFEPPPAGGKSAVALQFNLESRAAVDELHARLAAAGHASHLAPIDAFWGARYAEVADPDGNVAGFHGRDPA